MIHVDNPFQSPALLSICTGSGGLEKGIEHATGAAVRTVAHVEIEAFIIENLVRQMEQGILDPAPVWTDVKNFLQYAHHFRGKVHGITAGYPCQPFSKAGERKGEDDPRHLWPYIHRIIEAVRPVWCFFENVRGHLTMGYDQVYKDLRSIGYSVECGIYSAKEVGATHERERLFILAVADSYRMAERGRTGYIRSSQTAPEREMGEKNRERSRGNIEHISKEVDNTNAIISEAGRERARWETIADFDWSSARQQLGNTTVQGSEERIPDKGRQRKKRAADRTDHPSIRSRELGNTKEQLTQGIGTERQQGTAEDDGSAIPVSPGGGYRWPAPKGVFQHPWEAPRLVSGMDCTVNGYNFREDLLRMLGNAVVYQTAAKAYLDLLSKFR